MAEEKTYTFTLTEHEAETWLWALGAVVAMDNFSNPAFPAMLDQVPPVGQRPPYRSERLREFGQKIAKQMEAQRLLIVPKKN